MTQHSGWLRAYVALQKSEKFTLHRYLDPGLTYSRDAYAVFPRYRLAENTLINIERIVFLAGTPLGIAQTALIRAGSEAHTLLSEELRSHDPALAALQSQMAVYADFVHSLKTHLPEEDPPLPFRRVLKDEEAEVLWTRLRERWGIRGAGYGWFPLSNDPCPRGALTFHEELWKSRKGTSLLQRFMVEQEVSRCYLLRELGPPDYELDAVLAGALYDGSESFLFADGWLLYTSHESSLTVVGSLADFLRRQWEDADDLAYGGPFHTGDLRGSWGML